MRPIQEELRSHLCRAQKGWFVERPIVGCSTNHPRRAESSVTLQWFIRRGAPSLAKEGSSLPLGCFIFLRIPQRWICG